MHQLLVMRGFLLALTFLTALSAAAQTPDTTAAPAPHAAAAPDSVGVAADSVSAATDSVGAEVVVVLNDGTQQVGTLQGTSATGVTLVRSDGLTVTIPIARVARIEPSGDQWQIDQGDPNPTRLLFAPTARSVGNKNGYAALYGIFFPFVAYGAGDAVTLAGGVSLIPFSPAQVAYVAPKVTLVNTGTVQVAAGGFAGALVGSESSPVVGVGYVVGTWGTSARALTLGVGQGYAEGEASRPFALIGGEMQISPRYKLLTENYVFFESEGLVLLTAGIRFFGNRFSTDFAFATSPEAIQESGGFPLVPLVSFATML